jgi:RNA polymerase sigma-70 factor (ECF subfamily)
MRQFSKLVKLTMAGAAVTQNDPTLEGSREPNDCFEDLVREHQRMIHSLCYRMTGCLADADDLTQETFLQAYQHLKGFRAESRVSSWLYRIAVNQCLNWRKRVVRREQFLVEWSQEIGSGDEPRGPRAQQVQEALLKLSPEQRAVVVLTTYDGLSHAQAARVLECAETTVSLRLFTARRRLKRLLKDLE